MRSKLVGLVAGALLLVASLGATSASAATEFGDNCTANSSTTATVTATLFALTAAGDPLPLTAPSSGIITKWKITSTIPAAQTLRVFRQTGPKSVLVTGESAQSVATGANSFETRIPVQAGDRLGISSSGVLLYCLAPGPENVLGVFEGASVGTTANFEQIEAEARVPVAATIEPDADNDGYGDETQDKCPQSAAAQAACPIIALSTTATAKKGLANVLVTASAQAAVTVSGTVRLGKGKGNVAKLGGGTQIVLPGVISKFTLLFTKKLKDKLKQLTPKQSLTLKVTSTTPNIVGAPSVSTLNVKLKGQKKPKRKKGKAKAKGQA